MKTFQFDVEKFELTDTGKRVYYMVKDPKNREKTRKYYQCH